METPARDLMPNWAEQVSRVTCPCMNWECGYVWVRGGKVLTLSELFLALGEHYTAAQIYAFYRTLRSIAVKRRKGKGASAPASGSVKTGVTQSPFQAARMRLELIPNKELVLAGYAAVNNLGHLEPIKQNFDLAIRYLFKVMLRDLRPPWLAHAFLQALPGIGVLSRFTRPSFLHRHARPAPALIRRRRLQLRCQKTHSARLFLPLRWWLTAKTLPPSSHKWTA